MPAPSAHRLDLKSRLLADIVRQREESTGHPAHHPAADAAGRAVGGGLARRLCARAASLPEAPALRAGVDKTLQTARWMLLAGLLLAFLAGAGAASAALDIGPPASLPLVLAIVVGGNLLMLLLWLVLLAGRVDADPLTRAVLMLWRSLAEAPAFGRAASGHRAQGHPDERAPGSSQASAAAMALRRLLAAPQGRWLLSASSHALWLAFSLGAVTALTLLLSLKGYALSWESTLLGDAALQQLAESLSLAPALLGLPDAESLPLRAPMDASAQEAWARWLIAAVVIYGALPRALALLGCSVAAHRGHARIAREPHLPGFARLRHRLMPEAVALATDDAAEDAPQPVATSRARTGTLPPPERCCALAIECAPDTARHPDWTWLGAVDDASSREQAIGRAGRGCRCAGHHPKRGAPRPAGP